MRVRERAEGCARRLLGFLVALLKGYKRFVSPLLPPACRFFPTCSEYAVEALERYGLMRGGLLSLGRVCRCHPLCRGGYDPLR
ncbi:MAG: membrane protein insertion efficiency factor YidD [Acidobacteria bacterium]|nr:MAG: membrane protein insertion efficiency factor YidD [Acidobacteriota bacterium]